MEEQIKEDLNQAIADFTKNMVKIKKLAYAQGGQVAVEKVDTYYEDLRNKYFTILKKELDQNNAQYQALMKSVNSETEKLRSSINQLNNINDIMNLVTSVIDLAGKVISVLGV